ncbi:hypothetical protein DRJ17_00800 [Candidatus Woesearchaeota archaeon]|nr:MAG: hypothetical protein DRJ17_00800 [Candidatus Woesearchaeota archaeon]
MIGISSEDFEKVVDLDLGIDVILRRKTQSIDPDYGSLVSDSYQDTPIKVVWQEVTGEEENFRPEGEFKIGDIKCFTKPSYDNGNIVPNRETDIIVKDGKEHKIIKITSKTVGNSVVYRLLQLRLK